MFFIFSSFAVSDSDICSTIYSDLGCPVCITHFLDHQCGWCNTTSRCESSSTTSCPAEKFIYGPASKCDAPPAPVPVTPTPTPEPQPITGQCSMYEQESNPCVVCSSHTTDRNCGWCSTTQKCVDVEEGKANCPANAFYYGNNGVCGKPVPTPMPVWPVYVANTTFCSSLSGTWCENCISKNPDMQCGWCGATHECIPGYADGPLNLFCESGWSFTVDDKCLGKASHSTIVGVRVSVGIFIGVVCVLAILGCIKVVRKKAVENTYEEIQ